MAIERMEHVGVVVDDLEVAKEFFVELGLELDGQGQVDGETVDRINGLEGVRAEMAIMVTPDGDGKLEVIKYHSPPGPDGGPDAPANTPGIRHLLFRVDDIDETVARLERLGAELVGQVAQWENSYRLCYIRGPAGIIIELAERLG